MYVTSTMTSPVTKTAKTSKWLRLKSKWSCHGLVEHTYYDNFLKLSNYIHAMYLLFMIPCIFWGGNLAIQYINVIWSHFSLTLQIVTGDFWTQ